MAVALLCRDVVAGRGVEGGCTVRKVAVREEEQSGSSVYPPPAGLLGWTAVAW